MTGELYTHFHESAHLYSVNVKVSSSVCLVTSCHNGLIGQLLSGLHPPILIQVVFSLDKKSLFIWRLPKYEKVVQVCVYELDYLPDSLYRYTHFANCL